MPIASITGHTRGIGAALADQLTQVGYEVQGYSRSNGYDISQPDAIEQIVEQSQNSDVFVNNAYHDFAQCDILEKLFDLWKADHTKTIVNIGSRAKYGMGNAKFYGQTKKELDAKAKSMMFSNNKQCRIININPGYVETDMVKHVHGKCLMLSPRQVADAVMWCINQPQGIEVGELSIWTTTLN